MPSPFSPTPQIGASDPSLPDGPASNAATHRELLNNRRHLRGATWALLAWSGRLRIAGTSNTVFSVTVGVIEAVTLRDSNGVWRPYFTADETVLDLTHVEGAPANLSNDTFYYVYAWSDSAAPGAVKFQISTSPPTEVGTPTVLRLWKRGQTSNFRYLGCFRTNGSGTPLAMRIERGRYLYDRSAGLGDFEIGSVYSGGTLAATAVSAAALVPPHVFRCAVTVSVLPSGDNFTAGAGVSIGGSSARIPVVIGIGADTRDVEVLLDASQEFTRAVSVYGSVYGSGTPTVQLNTYARGFEE